MFLKLLFMAAVVAVCAEPPAPGFHRRAPYAAAGWRPHVPFNLPREYLPPSSRPAEPQRLRPSSVEITRERVEYAGQLVGNAPQSNYVPPQLDVPNEQALPNLNQAELFNKERENQPQPSQGQQQPASEYGPPNFRIVYPDDDEATSQADDGAQSAAQYTDFKEGRYFIVSPDNKLQKVDYRTAQDAQDATGEGFTAQLKYSTVGELQDSVFKYNNEGQLVRVLK